MGVPRQVKLPTRLRDTLVLAIQGVRRCGKSTLLAQLVERYELNPRHCASLSGRRFRELSFHELNVGGAHAVALFGGVEQGLGVGVESGQIPKPNSAIVAGGRQLPLA